MIGTILKLLLGEKAQEKWDKLRMLGKGSMTYLTGAAMVLSGLACALSRLLQNDSLAGALESLPELWKSNCSLLIGNGFAIIFGRRAIEELKSGSPEPQK